MPATPTSLYNPSWESERLALKYGKHGPEVAGLLSLDFATYSKGNLYTTETYRGQRLQKFQFKGVAAVAKRNQGVVWPKR